MDETLESLVEHAKGVVVSIGETFDKHDDDWAPHAILHTKEQGIVVVNLTGAEKQYWPPFLTKMIHELKVRRLCTIFSTWSLHDPSDEDIKKVQAGQSMEYFPNRREMVVIVGFDTSQSLMTTATIIRPPEQVPKLSEWESQPWEEIRGTQYEPLRKAMNEVQP